MRRCDHFPPRLINAFSRYTTQVKFEVFTLPPSWTELSPISDTSRVFKKKNGLAVMVGIEKHDEKRWKHVSMSMRRRLPTHAEMCEVKDIFIGTEETAIHVFPSREEKVNIHPNCFHLFSALDEKILPDFRTFFNMM